MQWEGERTPHAQSIRGAIQESTSLNVMQSFQLGELRTAGWTGFEIGLAVSSEEYLGYRGPCLAKPGAGFPN